VRAVVTDRFHDFSEPLEGRVPFMYLDSAEPRAFVTVGVGNLCPLSFALTLPFVHPDGHRASLAEISQAWIRVDARQDLKKHGGMVFGGLKGNELRLPAEAVDKMVERKLDETDRTLAGMFDAWAEWPACAQLALMSWAWAVGPHARYPRMFEALHARDFAMASTECDINPKRGTIVDRNARNRILLLNAARVVEFNLDADTLDWTHLLSVTDVETQPELPNAASEPTICVGTIVHPDPSEYLQNKPDDDDSKT
jgi:hypothetical protein